MKKVIILGDSIVEWNKKLSYINYGQAGYRTRDVFWQLEELENLDGDLGILMVGVNDILCGYEIEYTLDYYKKCVDEMRKKFKKIFFCFHKFHLCKIYFIQNLYSAIFCFSISTS